MKTGGAWKKNRKDEKKEKKKDKKQGAADRFAAPLSYKKRSKIFQ